MTIETVQHWVASLLIFAITSFPMGALVIACNMFFRDGETASAVVLCLMCGVIGIVAIVAMLLVHGHRIVSPYLALGLIPALGAAIAMLAA